MSTSKIKIYGALVLLALLSLGCDQKKDKKSDPGGGAVAVTTTTTPPPIAGEGDPAGTDQKPGSGDEEDPGGKGEDPANSDLEDEIDSKIDGENEDDNRFLVLQEKICQPSDSDCDSYGLNAKASKNGFCPYSSECADGDCGLRSVLEHFCNCIYQLEKGKTFFNGKDHDCIAELQEAEAEVED